MTATMALARAEMTMLARNRTAAVNAVLIPLTLGIVWIVSDPPAQFAPFGAALQVLVLAGMTIITTATTTLVARRQQQVLERWRSSGAASATVLAGTLAPMCLLLVAQAAILFTATAYATGFSPSQPMLLVLAVLLGGALAASLAFITAAFTRSVDAATITAFPAAAALIGGGIWAATAEAGEVTWLMLATGGGAVADLTRIGWIGGPGGAGLADSLSAAGPSILAILALTTVVSAAAIRTFRWGPRD